MVDNVMIFIASQGFIRFQTEMVGFSNIEEILCSQIFM